MNTKEIKTLNDKNMKCILKMSVLMFIIFHLASCMEDVKVLNNENIRDTVVVINNHQSDPIIDDYIENGLCHGISAYSENVRDGYKTMFTYTWNTPFCGASLNSYDTHKDNGDYVDDLVTLTDLSDDGNYIVKYGIGDSACIQNEYVTFKVYISNHPNDLQAMICDTTIGCGTIEEVCLCDAPRTYVADRLVMDINPKNNNDISAHGGLTSNTHKNIDIFDGTTLYLNVCAYLYVGCELSKVHVSDTYIQKGHLSECKDPTIYWSSPVHPSFND